MKKLFIILTVLIGATTTLKASEKVVAENMLPASIHEFIKTHYVDEKISIATLERDLFDKDYKVILVSGVKLEFDGKGDWTEVECKRNSTVPSSIIPQIIKDFIDSKFSAASVRQISKSRRYYEIELNDGTELKFNKKGELVEFDN